MDAQQLYRLMVLDHRLASEGVELQSTAEELGVTPETIWSDLELLSSVGCEIVCREGDAEIRGFYIGERLFNANHDTVHLSAMIRLQENTGEENPLVTEENREQSAPSTSSFEPTSAPSDAHDDAP
jgi:hypothetical protein